MDKRIELALAREELRKTQKNSTSAPEISKISEKSLDMIIKILYMDSILLENADALVDTIKLELWDYDDLVRTKTNWIYILVQNYLNVCSKENKDIIVHAMIRRAPECPMAVMSLLFDLNILDVDWVANIPSIQEALSKMWELAYRRIRWC